MALGRLDVPGLILYNGTIYPGVVQGQRNATVVSVFEAIGAYRAGKITPRASCTRSRTPPAPVQARAVASSPRTRCRMVLEFLGLSPAGLNGIPAEDPAKDDAARAAGELVMDLVRARHAAVVDRDPRVDRERDRLRRRDRRLDERRAAPARDRPRVRHPARHRRVRRDRGPDADRRRHAAGRPLHRLRHVRRRRRRAGHARAAQATGPAPRRRADGRRADDRRDRARRPSRRRARRSSSRSRRRSSRPAAWRSCAARSRPRAASSSSPATSGATIAGPARVFDSETACYEAVRDRQIKAGDVVVIRYEGPVGGPGHAGDAAASPGRSSARAWAIPWRSSRTAASPAAPTA